MKRYASIIIFWILSLWGYGQDQSAIVFPDYPGGLPALKEYLYHHFNDQYHINLDLVKETMYVEFVINPEGYVTSVRFLTHVSTEIENAMSETIKHMPKWSQGKNASGEPASFRFVLTI